MTEQRLVETYPPVKVYCRFQSFLTQMSPKRISLRWLKKEVLATNNVVKNVSNQLERRFKNRGIIHKSELQAACVHNFSADWLHNCLEAAQIGNR